MQFEIHLSTFQTFNIELSKEVQNVLLINVKLVKKLKIVKVVKFGSRAFDKMSLLFHYFCVHFWII